MVSAADKAVLLEVVHVHVHFEELGSRGWVELVGRGRGK